MQKSLFIILLFVGVLSCTSDDELLEYYVNSFEPQLSLSGYVTTDSIYACLTQTQKREFRSIYDPEIYTETITDTTATVVIYEDGKFFCRLKPKSYTVNKYVGGINRIEEKKYYTAYKMVSPGRTYAIKIEHNTFGAIEASTQLPLVAKVLMDTLSVLKDVFLIYDSSDGDATDGIDTAIWLTNFYLTISDIPSMSNYFMIHEMGYTHSNELEKYRNTPWSRFELNEVILESQVLTSYGSRMQKYLFSDKYFEDKDYSLCFYHCKDESDSIKYDMYYYSEDYYKYNLSVAAYQLAIRNPFSKPVLIHSNTSNDIGIWGAYIKETFSNN